MKLHNHVFTTSHIIGTTTFLFFFRSEAKRYAGADVKQRKKKGWPNGEENCRALTRCTTSRAADSLLLALHVPYFSRDQDLPFHSGWKRRSLLPNSKNYASNLLDMTRGAYFGNPKVDDVQY